ncbi:MAG: hypothetical protein RL095_2169 [Verrucomicrobiota bacterium]|jgi:hypothetical protein
MKFLCLLLSILALALVASCATADNPQRTGGVYAQGCVIFVDGNLTKSGDNAATSTQAPRNDVRPSATVPVNTGASGLADAGAAIAQRLAQQPASAPAPQPVPEPAPVPKAPPPAPKPDAAPLTAPPA